jgi:hypothetical protein
LRRLQTLVGNSSRLVKLAHIRADSISESISLELNHQAGADVYSALIQRRALAESHVENAILA